MSILKSIPQDDPFAKGKRFTTLVKKVGFPVGTKVVSNGKYGLINGETIMVNIGNGGGSLFFNPDELTPQLGRV